MHLFPFEYILSNSLFKFNFFILLKSNVSASVVVTSMAPEWIYVTEDSKQLKRVTKKRMTPTFSISWKKSKPCCFVSVQKKNPICSSSLIKIKILGLCHNIEFINVYNPWCKLRIEWLEDTRLVRRSYEGPKLEGGPNISNTSLVQQAIVVCTNKIKYCDGNVRNVCLSSAILSMVSAV